MKLGRNSEVIYYTIEKMLSWEESRRPSFSILKTFLDEEITDDRKLTVHNEKNYSFGLNLNVINTDDSNYDDSNFD